jgi:hypothetical protein
VTEIDLVAPRRTEGKDRVLRAWLRRPSADRA